MGRNKYSEFVDRIDMDEFYAAIGFEPLYDDTRGNDVGHCIFPENHSNGDTTGKFAIHPEKKVYNCWVCGGGSLLSLVMELNSWDSETAEEWLFQFAGEAGPKSDVKFLDEFMNSFPAQGSKNTVVSLPWFNPRVLEKWNYAWTRKVSPNIADPKAIERYGVRFADEAFKPAPRNGKFSEDDPYTGPAIIWPHFWNERLVGWQTRWLDDNRPKWVSKWTNTVDFPRDETLYGWDRLEHDDILVCESAKTVVFLSQFGISALGTFGDTVSDVQLKHLRRFDRIYLAPDNDPAGQKWLDRTHNYLKRYSEIEVVPPVPGLKADLADLPGFSAVMAHLNKRVDPVVIGSDFKEIFEWASPNIKA